MIYGTVIALHALIKVSFCLTGNSRVEREFVIDTGFTGFLTLPRREIETLGLDFSHRTSAYLADGSEIQIPIYDAGILWNGRGIDVRVLGTGQRPLLGTALLENHALWVQFAEFGAVEIEDL